MLDSEPIEVIICPLLLTLESIKVMLEALCRLAELRDVISAWGELKPVANDFSRSDWRVAGFTEKLIEYSKDDTF